MPHLVSGLVNILKTQRFLYVSTSHLIYIVEVCWDRKVKGCVNGHDIVKYSAQSLEQCKDLCAAKSNCLAFEYGVAYGGGGGYKAKDCQLQSSSNSAGCDGGYFDLDLYIKTTNCPSLFLSLLNIRF